MTTIQDLFGEQVARTPEAPAIVHRDATLTYAELNSRANQLAHRLIDAGLTPGTGVAVLCDRTPDMPVAMMGILKARGYYIPLDPIYPAARINGILSDAKPFALVTDRDADGLHAMEIQTEAPLIKLAAEDTGAYPDPPSGSADDLIYSIYTSGSTGKPKGTLNFQRGAVNVNQWMIDGFGVGPQTRALVLSSVGFDITSKAIYSPLLSGGTVVLYDSPVYDPPRIRQAIVDFAINTISHTPTGLLGLIEDGRPETYTQMAGIQRLNIIGESLQLDRFRHWLTHADTRPILYNTYGPTECSDTSSAHEVTDADIAIGGVCALGRALPNVVLTVRDSSLNLVTPGEKGELCVQGIGVGAGYRNLPEQTAAAFVDDPLGGGMLYRTGDLGSQRTDGLFLFHGRMDYQVKIRGHRVELGEIEQALSRIPGVVESVVTAPSLPTGERFVAAYLRTSTDSARDRSALNAALAVDLPDYMVPSAYTFMDSFPVNPSLKVDRKALPEPLLGRPALGTAYRGPADAIERTLADIWENLLGYPGIGINDPFFELGGNSLLATRLITRVNTETGAALTITQFFEAPTIAGVAARLRPAEPVATKTASAPPVRACSDSTHIAIVGMAARVPGATDIQTFWRNLLDGVDSLRILEPDELAALGVSEESTFQVPVHGWADDSETFDHNFFGYTPREAERIDPQQRLLLQAAVAAFEDAGLATATSTLRSGIYAGVAPNTYLTRNVLPHDQTGNLGLGYTLIGSEKDYAATRIAYKLGLIGPAMSVQTACSSSGVALHLACQALLADDCDVALAGGVSLPWQYRYGHEHIPGGALSADGRIRAFDAQASGMVLTGGGACVVLRRLEDAIADGHTIHAVIRATALNNDGSARASFTAPSIAGQRAVVRTALNRAGVNARSIGVLEAHGTGTPVGDPIEVTAITQSWREDTEDTGFCAIGSVKTNIGHLDAAAAMAGAIKLALMIREGERPATLNFDTPNPDCALETSPFFVNDTRTTWSDEGPRRGALSSFGFGGTNFHAIFEQGPVQLSTPSGRDWQVLRLSARTAEALQTQISDLARALVDSPDSLADIAYTLDVGRNGYPHRAAVVAGTIAQAAERLTDGQSVVTGHEPQDQPHLVFGFPGQGAQHTGMGQRLYQTESVFRSAVNQCADILLPALNVDLRNILFDADSTDALRGTQLAQPAIFTISYATAKLWMSWGVKPQNMLGHSVGEFVAATLAGVFELEHALLILAERARLMQSMPSGGMLAVRLSEQDTQALLDESPDEVAIAGVNSPKLTVLSGPHAGLDAVRARLVSADVPTTTLHTSHAFHSPMMDPIIEPFTRVVAQYPRNAPSLPFYSSLTGLPITDEQAQDPSYWAEQLRNAVRFAPALLDVAQTPGCVLLECGPGQNLTTSARQSGVSAVASLPHAGIADADDSEHLATALGRLFLAGVETDARHRYAGETRIRVSLPTYPFAKTRHWLTPAGSLPVTATPALTETIATQQETPSDPADRLITFVRTLFAEVAGVDIGPADDHTSFLELGFDSLLLTQITTQVNRKMALSLRFRQLLEEFPTPAGLAAHLVRLTVANGADIRAPKAFGAGARIEKSADEALTPRQREALDDFVARYTARTAGSRAYADEHRPHLADRRAVSGFRPLWKDLVYPIVSDTSKGPRFTDIDGNNYVDISNGFGSAFFGHRPDFVVDAVHRQIERDINIGPQNPIVGECARMFGEMTGHDRVAFCNNGSQAVIAAVQLARAVTGRNLIVQHEGDNHGIMDEVLVRSTPSGLRVPAAPGIPTASVANNLVLEYGTAESLAILRERAHELAAVLIEPVRSRTPDLQPADYVREVRKICDESGTAMIMDEEVSGFRVHQAGAQGLWGVKADIACYGKVFGGGMPVGALAGSIRFMNALDGGGRQFGDDWMPEAGVTYFASTFVRNPMTMAVVRATLQHLKDNPDLQERTSAITEVLVDRLNGLFAAEGVPLRIGRFGSLMKPSWTQDLKFDDLFYYFLREAGVNAWDSQPTYLTTEHGEAEVDFIVAGFAYAVAQMKQGGFFDDVTPTAALLGVTVSADGATISVPSTESQREVWMAARFVGNNSVAYNEGLSLIVDGCLDVAALRHALQQLLDRHEALRARFSRDGRSLLIDTMLELFLPQNDLSRLDPHTRLAELERIRRDEMAERFDLRNGPLVRFRLVRLGAEEHQLLIVAHHTVTDGWSGAVVISELAALYSARVEGRPAALPAAPRYSDYCAVEHYFRRSLEGQLHQDYWIKQLREAPPPPHIPGDRTPVAEVDLSAARVDRPLDAELVRQLRAVGSAHGASLVATMVTGFAGLLQQRTGQEDLVIGLAAAGQAFHSQGQLVGHCVNLLPLRVQINSADSFTDALLSTRGALLDAYEHQGVSVGTLIQHLDLVREGNRPPLVSVVLNVDVRDADIRHAGLTVGYEMLERQAENFELLINVADDGTTMVLETSYRTALYSERLIEELLAQFEDLLRNACSNPAGAVGQL